MTKVNPTRMSFPLLRWWLYELRGEDLSEGTGSGCAGRQPGGASAGLAGQLLGSSICWVE